MPESFTERRTIRIAVNGVEVEREVCVRTLLADFIREDLRLTGTHLGCEHGVCGACTVVLDGQSVRSCLMLAVQAEGCTLETIEGLACDGKLSPLQEAFREEHALQCGFCTSGFLMTARELLEDEPNPNEQQVREAISGNLCRCTGYANIVAAIMRAAATRGAK
ncbi:MAG: (2Fe-2S)-binding protein [Candidatus Binataceae bacterium]|jgi:aerobic-type carbon monoxide dehydrogenase small subunit (CoxS/CutS family)